LVPQNTVRWPAPAATSQAAAQQAGFPAPSLFELSSPPESNTPLSLPDQPHATQAAVPDLDFKFEFLEDDDEIIDLE